MEKVCHQWKDGKIDFLKHKNMVQTGSKRHNLIEIFQLRTYNRKTFRTSFTKERRIFTPYGNLTRYYGQFVSEFHVKPIHYIAQDGTWRNLDEIASYFGNKMGMVLKSGWEDKVHFGYLAWYLKRQKLINGRGIMLPYSRIPLLVNTVSDFLPDPDPETTTVDGTVRAHATGTVYANTHDATDGDVADPTAATVNWAENHDNLDADPFYINRGFLLFDTSSIPDGDTIDSATIVIVGTSKANDNSDSINIYLSTPATNTNLVLADVDQVGTVVQATAITNASWNTAGDNTFTLNATGLTNISKTGVTKFGTRSTNDVANTEPTGANRASGRTADTAGTGDDPVLSVTHSSAVNAAGMMPLSF